MADRPRLASGARRTILYFGNDWAAENRTSSHHIARWLAKYHDVYYIECPGMRAPKASGRDFRKVVRKIIRFLVGIRLAEDGLKVQTLLQIPLHRFAIMRRFNRILIQATLRWLILRKRIRDPITWFTVPHLAAVAGQLNEILSIYYCIDDYAALPDVNTSAVQEMDDELTRRVDLVFLASDTLFQRKCQLNDRTFISPHGVDLEHFGRAHVGLECPKDIRSFPRPIIGFFGLIERWIDLELVAYLAKHRPTWTFLMIGRVAVPDAEVPQFSNLYFLGKRAYDDLPAYGKQFDAAIIPYRLNRQVLHANPLKLREYLAMGKPIVSVSTPEIDKFADVVAIAHSPEEFLAKLDATLASPLDPLKVRRRMERVSDQSWDTRLRWVWSLVEVELNGAMTRRAAEATTRDKSRSLS